MRKLEKWFRKAKQAPAVSRALRPLIRHKMGRQINQMTRSFSTHFDLTLAVSPTEKQACYQVRHEVYCSELQFEPLRPNGLEHDAVDEYSMHCYVTHKRTGKLAGTIRLVMPMHAHQELPIETYCSNAITVENARPSGFARGDVCEVSRLAVPKQFRRRGPISPIDSNTNVLLDDQRCFPYISLALYFMASNLTRLTKRENVYVMMEPKLARSLKMIGLQLNGLGDPVDYHGKRSAYYMATSSVMDNLPPSLSRFHDQIGAVLLDQFEALQAKSSVA